MSVYSLSDRPKLINLGCGLVAARAECRHIVVDDATDLL